MNFEINKERFNKLDYDPSLLINEFLQNGSGVGELDVLTFKLKILQREISNELEFSINNLIKSCSTAENDFKTFSSNIEHLNSRYYDIRKNKNIETNDLDKLNKASALQSVNSNLKFFLVKK